MNAAAQAGFIFINEKNGREKALVPVADLKTLKRFLQLVPKKFLAPKVIYERKYYWLGDKIPKGSIYNGSELGKGLEFLVPVEPKKIEL